MSRYEYGVHERSIKGAHEAGYGAVLVAAAALFPSASPQATRPVFTASAPQEITQQVAGAVFKPPPQAGSAAQTPRPAFTGTLPYDEVRGSVAAGYGAVFTSSLYASTGLGIPRDFIVTEQEIPTSGWSVQFTPAIYQTASLVSAPPVFARSAPQENQYQPGSTVYSATAVAPIEPPPTWRWIITAAEQPEPGAGTVFAPLLAGAIGPQTPPVKFAITTCADLPQQVPSAVFGAAAVQLRYPFPLWKGVRSEPQFAENVQGAVRLRAPPTAPPVPIRALGTLPQSLPYQPVSVFGAGTTAQLSVAMRHFTVGTPQEPQYQPALVFGARTLAVAEQGVRPLFLATFPQEREDRPSEAYRRTAFVLLVVPPLVRPLGTVPQEVPYQGSSSAFRQTTAARLVPDSRYTVIARARNFTATLGGWPNGVPGNYNPITYED